jgi:hypothetical protein
MLLEKTQEDSDRLTTGISALAMLSASLKPVGGQIHTVTGRGRVRQAIREGAACRTARKGLLDTGFLQETLQHIDFFFKANFMLNPAG